MTTQKFSKVKKTLRSAIILSPAPPPSTYILVQIKLHSRLIRRNERLFFKHRNRMVPYVLRTKRIRKIASLISQTELEKNEND